MDIDEKGKGPELRIKGQAEVEKRKSKWDGQNREDHDDVSAVTLSTLSPH